MPISIRRLLFAIFVVAFFIIGAGLVFYSQGYRLDAKNLALEKVGGIFVRSYPKDAAITINREPIKNKSWLLQSGTLVDNLLPASYELVIQKDGYKPWKKKMAVKPSLVTEADAIVLIPDMQAEKIISGADDLWIENGTLVLKNKSGKLFLKSAAAATSTEQKAIPIGDEFIALRYDKKTAMTRDSSTNVFFLTDFEKNGSVLNLNLLFNNLKERVLGLPGNVAVKKAAFHPYDSQKLVIATDKAIYLIDLEKLAIKLIGEAKIGAFAVTENEILWQNTELKLTRYSLSANAKKTLANFESSAVFLEANATIIENKAGALQSSGILTITNQLSGDTKLLADKAAFFHFSPDKQKIAFVDYDGKINVEYFNKNKRIAFFLQENGAIESFKWYKDSEHLIVKFKNGKVFFTENDDRQPLNAYLLAENVKKYFYDSDTDSVYFLKDDGVFRFVFN